MKRLVVSAGAVMALLLSGGVVSAVGDGMTFEIVPLTFAPLNSTTCSNLPAGTSLTWSGTGTSITHTKTASNGIKVIVNFTYVQGLATDQSGKTHAFKYLNSYRVANTVAKPAVFTGLMMDSFTLGSREPIKLNAGFVAKYTDDAGTFHFVPLHAYGDPINFADGGAARCDPL